MRGMIGWSGQNWYERASGPRTIVVSEMAETQRRSKAAKDAAKKKKGAKVVPFGFSDRRAS